MFIQISFSSFLFLLVNAASLAVNTERELIDLFSSQGDIKSFESMKGEIGNLTQPAHFQHYNYRELTKYLRELAHKYPNFTHLYSIGRSVQGRELWVFTVSKYPKRHTPGIPEFKYIANMHGNEVTGRVFLVYLAWLLLENYSHNRWIRNLVDTTRIHLMPSMNPDGYEESVVGDESGTRGRTNANGRDLNRNFPSRFPNYFQSQTPEPETLAVMKWTKNVPFILSANLHGGTTIVNYPFDDAPTRTRDHRYAPSPDNALFVRLAYSYARTHVRMWRPGPRCLDENLNIAIDPQQGIVNGAEWYIVPGGMQDWNYLNTNCFEVTVEINCVKFPHKRDLRVFWDENLYAMLHYISQIHNAIHGFIYDSETGLGIPNATISIDMRAKIVTSFEFGEFWRLSNIGDYELTFDHPGYTPVTQRVIITRDRRNADIVIYLDPLSTQTNEILPRNGDRSLIAAVSSKERTSIFFLLVVLFLL